MGSLHDILNSLKPDQLDRLASMAGCKPDPAELCSVLPNFLHSRDINGLRYRLAELRTIDPAGGLSRAAALQLLRDSRFDYVRLGWRSALTLRDYDLPKRERPTSALKVIESLEEQAVWAKSPADRVTAMRRLRVQGEWKRATPLLICLAAEDTAVVHTALETILRRDPQLLLTAWQLLSDDAEEFHDNMAVCADFFAKAPEISVGHLIAAMQTGGGGPEDPLAGAIVRHRFDEVVCRLESEIKSPEDPGIASLFRSLERLFAAARREKGRDAQSARTRIERFFVSKLSHALPGFRASALRSLARCGWPRWEERARTMLSDPDQSLRRRVVATLAERLQPDRLDCLTPLFTDPDAQVRGMAFAAVARRSSDDGPLVRGLKRMLRHADAEIRSQGVKWLGEFRGPEDIELALPLLEDEVPDVRRAAAGALLRRAPKEVWEGALRGLLSDADPGVRADMVELSVKEDVEWEAASIARLLRDKAPRVRLATLKSLPRLMPDRDALVDQLRRKSGDRHENIRWTAVEMLAEHGGAGELPTILGRFKDRNENVRFAALREACRLEPSREREFAAALLTDPDVDVVTDALNRLADLETSEDLQGLLFDALPRARGVSGRIILERIQASFPDRYDEALRLALQSPSVAARIQVLDRLACEPDTSLLEQVRASLGARDGDVRVAALKAIRAGSPDDAWVAARTMLRDPDWEVRLLCVEILAERPCEELLDDLLPLARDEDEDVRRETIGILARYPDPRVVSEVISSVNDVDENVRDAAREALRGEDETAVRLGRYIDALHGCSREALLKKVESVNRWASKVGEELLGTPVSVVNYRQGLGRTRRGKRSSTVQIEVTDTPLTTGHPHGEEVMKGLALHEIGHHLCDFRARGFRTADGIAKSEGLDGVFDILLDERLERVLRSRRGEWRVYFDRLASYAFAQEDGRIGLAEYGALADLPKDEIRERIVRGELPGQLVEGTDGSDDTVVLRRGEMLGIPGLVPAEMAFLMCLRCGFDPRLSDDPRVVEAVAAVPGNLKDLPHKELLVVARRIGAILEIGPQSRRQMERFRKRLKKNRRCLRGLQAACDRLAETGQVARRPCPGAPDIRVNRTAPPTDARKAPPKKPGGGRSLNLGEERGYPPLEDDITLHRNPAEHARLVEKTRRHVRQLRRYFEQLGRRTVEEYASRRGRRLDLAQVRGSIFRHNPNFLVHRREIVAPSAYVGILIDRSGSMQGEKMERAKRFATLVAESLRDLRGIDGHVSAFDDDTFYWLGGFRDNAVSALEAGGGNNDAGGLHRAASLALASGKRNRMLVMISDGQPAECTFESLKHLVERLTRQYDIVCAQVAVDTIDHVAFPHFVDLSRRGPDEAASLFGKMLVRLTRHWR